MEQHELKEGRLLNYEGNLNEVGFAYSLVKKYRRKEILKRKNKIKEWDYYAVIGDNYALAFTISDLTLFGLISVSIIDLVKKRFKTLTKIRFFTKGKMNLPSTSEKGDVEFKSKNFKLKFSNDGEKREIKGYITNFYNNKDLDVDIILSETTKKSMVIVTPFFKNGQFYYNQKINNIIANGYFKLGNKLHTIKDNMAVLDWGRGVWPHKVTWYWASCSFKDSSNNYIGFNLGYGFGDTSKASENMLFVNSEAFKFNDVKFYFKQGKKKKEIDYLGDIKMYSQSKDIDLVFTPILDRHEDTITPIASTYQHQIFGKYNGSFKVNDKTYYVKDALGFIEKVKNRW